MPAISQSDLEEFFTVRLVRQVFCDDGGKEPGPRLLTALKTAGDEGTAILGKIDVWETDEAVQTLVDEDNHVRHAFCKLAMSIGADAKPEWSAGGDQSQAAVWRKQGRDTLNDLVKSATRSRGEKYTGSNTVTMPRVANARQFEFARRRGGDSSGGF